MFYKPDRVTSAAKPLSDSKISSRRESILRSYTKAVVKDAVVKARDYMEQGKFDKAEAVVETAEAIVNKNRVYLGDKLFRRFNDKLAKLRAKIGRQQSGQSPWYKSKSVRRGKYMIGQTAAQGKSRPLELVLQM